MKKLFTLFVALVGMVIPLLAETQDDTSFAFVDANGNELADGSTVNITTGSFNDEALYVMLSGVRVKNVSGGTSTYLKVNYTISQLDNGAYQICFPSTCNSKYETGTYETSSGNMEDNEVRDLQSEWIAAAEGSCVVTLQIETLTKKSGFPPKYTHKGYGPTITLNFKYDPNGGEQIKGDVNGDGYVSIADVNAIINVMLNGEENPTADVNGDGTISVGDINETINIILTNQ